MLVASVEFERVRVRVLKTRVEIRLMNEVRTVLRVALGLVLILRGVHDRASFFPIQQSESQRRSLFGRRSLSLRLRGWRGLSSCRGAHHHPPACQTHPDTNSPCTSPFILRFLHFPPP